MQRFTVLHGEVLAVKGQQSNLEIDAIAEMVVRSPYPVVNSIAAQALAALCGEHSPCERVPKWLRSNIREIFIRSFRITAKGPIVDKHIELLESSSTVERLARALLHFHENPSRYLEREVPVMVLKAFILTSDLSLDSFDAEACSIYAQEILQHDFIGVSLVDIPPRIRNLLLHAVEASARSGVYSSEQRNAFYQDLLKNLDPEKPPLLKQCILISALRPGTTSRSDFQLKDTTGSTEVSSTPSDEWMPIFTHAVQATIGYISPPHPNSTGHGSIYIFLLIP
jgi:hypothetical protein